VSVLCQAGDKKLTLPLERILDDFKVPILELSKQERVKFSQEQTDGYVDSCGRIVERMLNVEEIRRNSILVPFTRLILNEQASGF